MNADQSPFPNTTQKLLLQASLLNGSQALGAWNQWRSNVDFETDIEYGSFRQLPLLYQNLNKLQLDHPLMDRLKGIYRQSWSKNQILFHRTAKVIKLLEDAGIQTLILKGIALTILVYRNFGVRPMADMDILVKFSDARKTIDLLKKKDWIAQDEQYLEHNLLYGRSITFLDPNKTELDLHWHPIFESHDLISDTDFWDKAVPLEVSGVSTLAFCTTDALFHTVVHGLRYNPEPPIRWVADAMLLLCNTENPVDWDRLLNHSKKFRVSLQMRDAFDYLRENFKAPVPDDVFNQLSEAKSSFFDRFVYRHARKYGDKEPFTFTEKLYTIYASYIRQSSETGFFRLNFGFIKYMRFRTKGKPYCRILFYYFRLFFERHDK